MPLRSCARGSGDIGISQSEVVRTDVSVRPAVKPYGVGVGASVGVGVAVSAGVAVGVGVEAGVAVGVGEMLALGAMLGAALGVAAVDITGVGPGVTGASVGCESGATMGGSVDSGAAVEGVRAGAAEMRLRLGSTDERADGLADGAAVPVAPSTAPTTIGVGEDAELETAGGRMDCTTMTPVATPRTTALRTRA